MGKGGEQGEASGGRAAGLAAYTWPEIQRHNLRADKWLVIERRVYDISRWVKRHPGGLRVISHYAGEDATVRPPRRPHAKPGRPASGAALLAAAVQPWAGLRRSCRAARLQRKLLPPPPPLLRGSR